MGVRETIGLRLSDVEYAKLTKLAAELRIPPSTLLRELMVKAFDERHRAPAGTKPDVSISLEADES
jgi:hypothetical protein